jgi:hypothetical protein
LSLRDAVAAAARVRRKPPNWLDRLSASQRAEIEEIKRSWLAGEFSASAMSLAVSLVENCRERGIMTCGVQGVRSWLGQR